jgi:hypothetical protein
MVEPYKVEIQGINPAGEYMMVVHADGTTTHYKPKSVEDACRAFREHMKEHFGSETKISAR